MASQVVCALSKEGGGVNTAGSKARPAHVTGALRPPPPPTITAFLVIVFDVPRYCLSPAPPRPLADEAASVAMRLTSMRCAADEYLGAPPYPTDVVAPKAKRAAMASPRGGQKTADHRLHWRPSMLIGQRMEEHHAEPEMRPVGSAVSGAATRRFTPQPRLVRRMNFT